MCILRIFTEIKERRISKGKINYDTVEQEENFIKMKQLEILKVKKKKKRSLKWKSYSQDEFHIGHKGRMHELEDIRH